MKRAPDGALFCIIMLLSTRAGIDILDRFLDTCNP